MFGGSRVGVGDTSESPWVVVAVVPQWIPDEYFSAIQPLHIHIPSSDLNLWHPVHTRQLQPPPWIGLFGGRAAAFVPKFRVAIPIYGVFSLWPVPEEWGLNGLAAQRHVGAGCSLMESKTTDLFVKMKRNNEKLACLDYFLKYLKIQVTSTGGAQPLGIPRYYLLNN